MSDIQIGELYSVKEFFWFLYPTKELASVGQRTMGTGAWGWGASVPTYLDAKWFGKEYSCNVSVVEENTYFMLLEQDEKFFKVLDSNGNLGWIRCDDFSNYFELIKAKQ